MKIIEYQIQKAFSPNTQMKMWIRFPTTYKIPISLCQMPRISWFLQYEIIWFWYITYYLVHYILVWKSFRMNVQQLFSHPSFFKKKNPTMKWLSNTMPVSELILSFCEHIYICGYVILNTILFLHTFFYIIINIMLYYKVDWVDDSTVPMRVDFYVNIFEYIYRQNVCKLYAFRVL